MSDQTAAAGPSTIPIITISTEKLPPSESEDSSSVSSAMSPTLTALETPTTLEHPLSQLETLEQELAAFAQKKQGGNPTVSQEPTIQDAVERIDATPPRTQSGVPNPLKRSNKTPAKAQQDEKSIQDTPNGEIQPWHGVVVDYSPPQKEQAVIFPAKMVYSSPNIPYNNEAWAFQRATGYSDYIGSGFVFINVNGEKRRKNVKDNTYVFIVLEGVVEVLIHQTSYAVSSGGVFVVPRGNYYTIRNISEKEAKLFFTQTRKSEAETTVDTRSTKRPTNKSFLLFEWFLQRLITYSIQFRSKAFDWYWNNLAKYRHLLTTRRLYFLFFVLGLIVRRLPFVGSPPILNIQILRLR